MKNIYTMVSLFSSAGVGDFGFKEAGFKTVATNELLKERMEIQKINKKCEYENGYIQGDITLEKTKSLIMDEVTFWKNKYNLENIDLVVATPPCQGMSTANYKKNNELPRNSLVMESLEMISRIEPRYFVLENVRSFLKTICFSEIDKEYKTIEEAIEENLGRRYNIFSQVINFKEYGVGSSRPRTIVIGTRKDMPNLSPLLVFPKKEKQIPLKKTISKLKKIPNPGDFDNNDILHMFREYPEYMREWISDLKQGETAFKGKVIPYKIVNNKRVELKSAHLGNKFSRMWWDKPSPAIHTRSDQLASNRTIHPEEDRVLSIRELMLVMSIPKKFKWFLDTPKIGEEISFMRKKELIIRRSIGEAVPTKIFNKIAEAIKKVDSNPFQKLYSIQYEDDRMEKNAAFYTPQSVIFNVLKNIRKIGTKRKTIRILEPSSGWGTFLIQASVYFQEYENVEITLMDIDAPALKTGSKMFENIKLPNNVKVNWTKGDFLKEDSTFDFIIGNPPYMKIGYKNLYSLFLEKAIKISNSISLIVPKTILNSDADLHIRQEIQENWNITSLIEFGVRTFASVNIETIVVTIDKFKKNDETIILNYFELPNKVSQKYITLEKIWIPYRDEKFDEVFEKISLNKFKSLRDRQITNKYLKEEGEIRVLKSKNLAPKKILEIDGYDKYINDINSFAISKMLNKKNVILVPNFTYNFRAVKLPRNCIGNGGVVFLEFIEEPVNINKVISFFNTEEFGYYYKILHSFAKFTLNINKTITYYLGVINENSK